MLVNYLQWRIIIIVLFFRMNNDIPYTLRKYLTLAESVFIVVEKGTLKNIYIYWG